MGERVTKEQFAREQVVAFRLGTHHLADRLPRQRQAAAVGACGIQNSPPGSALLAVHARLDGVTEAGLATAVDEDKSLLLTWCMRGSPYLVPTDEAAVFTTGVLPTTEGATRRFILGVEQSLDRLEMSIADTVGLVDEAVRAVLRGRRLAIDQLGVEVAARVADRLSPSARDVWEQEGPHAPGQPIGEAVVHFCVRILTLQQVLCFAPRIENKAPFVLTDEWLSEPIPSLSPEAARSELLRRYLHTYGPSTRAAFATWLGIRSGDAGPWWDLLADDMVPVAVEGTGRNTTAWMLADDVDAMRAASLPQGVRLLPPRDPYTQLRDRTTIVDKSRHRQVWQRSGDPGTVLVDGEIVGTWRPRKSGRTLTVRVEPFGALTRRQEKGIRDEADTIAPLRGASAVSVELAGA
ncbi:winged helix DNA-binding domain-containing protein [Gordonia sp. CPCC 206044]|uniref:winged helix DNA-binding domain-containing protein n=1 Tax=Gordonia sp. CPCC 206044 TaxID=3140793 RepID=UPI003AF347E5